MLTRIAALPNRKDQERQLLRIASYLAPDAMRDLLLGRGPMGTQNCARLLGQNVATRSHDKTLAPLIEQIEKSAVRAAALKVIDRHGRIHHGNRFADDLVPGLTDLAVTELIRLKLARALRDLRSLLGR